MNSSHLRILAVTIATLGPIASAQSPAPPTLESPLEPVIYPKIELKGGMKLGARESLVLEAPRAGNPKGWYFDVETGLLLRSDERTAAGNIVRFEEFDNYKSIDGVKVPFTIRMLEEASITITLTEVKQNVSIEASVFNKPK